MPFDYDAPIYYPPYENRSILIPASYGCPHNQCAFCSMYKDTPYREVSLLDIKQSIREVSEYRPYSERVFLLGGQSFCLKADKLKEILRYIRERLPLCEAVSMYASIRSVADKTDADLAELKALGLGKLYIGVETVSYTHLSAGFSLSKEPDAGDPGGHHQTAKKRLVHPQALDVFEEQLPPQASGFLEVGPMGVWFP